MQRIFKFLNETWNADGPVRALFAAAVVSLLIFAIITLGVASGVTLNFDRSVMHAFRSGTDSLSTMIGPPWMQEMARDVTALGSFSILIVLLLSIGGFLCLIRQRQFALFLIVVVVGGAVLSNVLKFVIGRPRHELFPLGARVFSNSFPSDHAALSMITYMTLGALLAHTMTSRAARIYVVAVAALLAFMIGASRVYLGVHYPTDILAGWSLGAAWALGCWIIMMRLQRAHHNGLSGIRH